MATRHCGGGARLGWLLEVQPLLLLPHILSTSSLHLLRIAIMSQPLHDTEMKDRPTGAGSQLIKTPLTELFGIKHPITLAGMNVAVSVQRARRELQQEGHYHLR